MIGGDQLNKELDHLIAANRLLSKTAVIFFYLTQDGFATANIDHLISSIVGPRVVVVVMASVK